MSANAAVSRAERFSSNSSRIGSLGGDTHHPALTVGSERKARANIRTLQLREISQNFLLAHT